MDLEVWKDRQEWKIYLTTLIRQHEVKGENPTNCSQTR
jgi:hypothetical protein